MTKTTLTPEQLASVAHLSSRKAAEKLGVGKSTINDARAKLGTPGPQRSGKSSVFERNLDGSLIIESTDSIPQSEADILDRMRQRGFDPERYSFSYRFSEWEAQTADGVQTLYAARAGAVERKQSAAEALTADDIYAYLDNWVPIRGEATDPDVFEPNVFVFCFADPQFGKTDLNGGTEATIARFNASLDHACTMLDEHPATQIIWADLGDGIENFCNTTSQRQTNDLNLVEQVRVLRRLQMQGIMRFQEYAPVVHVSVPSNHSQNRVTFQGPASTAHDDWGLEVQQQLNELVTAAAAQLTNTVTFITPDEHLESVSFTTGEGTRLGFVHGHRATRQTGLEQWWAGQSLGRQPTHDADILLVGHFHNYNINSVGDGRYIITTPSLDNGSSWFTVQRGNVATAGVLTFRVRSRFPESVRIA